MNATLATPPTSLLATPEQVEKIVELESRLTPTATTPPHLIEQWPQAKAEQQITYLSALDHDQKTLPRVRSKLVVASGLLAKEGVEVRDVVSVAPNATAGQIESAVEQLIDRIVALRDDKDMPGTRTAVERSVARAARKLRSGRHADQVDTAPGFYILDSTPIRVSQSKHGVLYAQYRPTPSTWAYLADGMAPVHARAVKATVRDLAAYGHETKTCFVCGRELTHPESIEAGIGSTCRLRV